MTIIDVIGMAICEAVRRYFKAVGYDGEGPIQFAITIGAPKYPSKFPDEYEV